MILSHPNQPQGLRGAGNGSDEQMRVQRTQIEAPVKSLGKCAQVAGRILAEVKRMITPAQTRFEITEKGVDPFELG